MNRGCQHGVGYKKISSLLNRTAKLLETTSYTETRGHDLEIVKFSVVQGRRIHILVVNSSLTLLLEIYYC